MPVHRYKYFQPKQAAQLRRLELVVRGVVEGAYAGLHKSPHKGFSIEFAEHREYSPGDETRRLDWSVLARTDRYYIKQYEQETNLRATVCLDASASMDYGSAATRGPDGAPQEHVTKFQYGCVLAASMAFLLSNQQDMVGLVAFDDKIRVELPQGNGPGHLDQIFVQLEKLTPGKLTNIANTLHMLSGKIPRRGLVVLISDLLDDPDKLLQGLQRLHAGRHQLLVLQVLDRTETDLPFNQPVTLLDAEDGSRLQIDPKLIRDDYRREMENFLATVKRRCGEHRMDYMLCFTDVPWDQQLREVLSRMARR